MEEWRRGSEDGDGEKERRWRRGGSLGGEERQIAEERTIKEVGRQREGRLIEGRAEIRLIKRVGGKERERRQTRGVTECSGPYSFVMFVYDNEEL